MLSLDAQAAPSDNGLKGSDEMTNDELLLDAWREFLVHFEWQSFITLTFKDEVSRETVLKKFHSLVQILNRDLYGKHYTRIVGHSYFSYAVALESQRRGVLHVHMLVDKPIKFDLVHIVWNKIAGFAYIKPVKNKDVIGYLLKYVTKGGDVDVYRCGEWKDPAFLPMWLSEHLRPVTSDLDKDPAGRTML